MAQAMASMAGLRGSSQAVLEVSLQLRGSSSLNGAGAIKVALANPGFGVKANLQPETDITSRRAALGLVAVGIASGSFVQAVLAEDYKPCEGLVFSVLSPAQAADRAKESAKDMVNMIQSFIDKETLKYIPTYLNGKASILFNALSTAISATKSKETRKSLKDLTGKLYTSIRNLETAANIPSSLQVKKYSDETVSELNAVISFPCSE